MNPVETGFYYLQNRYYDPESCRFLSADDNAIILLSNMNLIGINLLSYCNNNSVNMHDPTGYYAVALALAPSFISSLSGALAGIMTSIAASMASLKTAILASRFIPVCIAASAITISSVKANVAKSGVKSGNDNTVYVITRKGTNDVVYAGRTCNFFARKTVHQKRFPSNCYTMYAVATGLTLSQARALEQTIITAYTIDTLKNMINSISPSKWGNFKTEFNQMGTFIQSWADPE